MCVCVCVCFVLFSGHSTKLISQILGTFQINCFMPKLLESFGIGVVLSKTCSYEWTTRRHVMKVDL